jgi:hypothetical protein
MKNINLLRQWYEVALIESSPFNPYSRITRKKVEFIYNTMLQFLGLNFFEVKKGTDKAIHKISWLFSLLSNTNKIECYHALNDICFLIEYSKSLDSSLQKELKQLTRNPENLRTFFFELFIFRLLDKQGIPNLKKPIVDGKPLEGICELNGKEFLFECRKIFLPQIEELDVKRRLMTDLWQLGQAQKYGRGMICTIQLSKPITPQHRDNFKQKLLTYFARLNEISQAIKIDYKHTDELGIFAAIDYDVATLIEIQARKNFDLVFYVVPPEKPILGTPNLYHAKVICNFSVYQSQIYKKLETVLKEKMKQHRNISIDHKILFLDNEILPEFHMNLFQNESMYESDVVRRLHQKLKMKHILCIVRRYYTTQGTRILFDVIGPEHLQAETKQLKLILQSYSVVNA